MLFLNILFGCLLFSVEASSQELIKKSAIAQDMQYMVRTIENVHPDPYHSISKEKFYSIRDSVLQSFPDSLTTIDAWKGFAFLVASLNEGHSDVRLPNEIGPALDNGSILLFPVLISQFTSEGLVVRADLSPDSVLRKGDTIVAINGIPATEIAERLCSTVGGLRNWRELVARQDFAMQLFMHGIKAPYALTYRHNGIAATKTVEALTKQNLIAALSNLRKSTVTTSNEPYRFTRLDNNVGYLDFKTMSVPYEPFTKFLEETFAGIKENPVSGLIIDLRRNGGGNSLLGYSLLTYITDKPFRMGAGSKWKVSEEYRQLNLADLTATAEKSKYVKKYLSLPAGEILPQESQPEKPKNNHLRFKGKVCVLIGPNTFSSANMTANAVQDFNLATLIGEASGEPANDYGELYKGVLPNTKISFVTSSKMFVRANGDAFDKNPVLPHIAVKQNPASDKDDVLNFAIEWIKKN